MIVLVFAFFFIVLVADIPVVFVLFWFWFLLCSWYCSCGFMVVVVVVLFGIVVVSVLCSVFISFELCLIRFLKCQEFKTRFGFCQSLFYRLLWLFILNKNALNQLINIRGCKLLNFFELFVDDDYCCCYFAFGCWIQNVYYSVSLPEIFIVNIIINHFINDYIYCFEIGFMKIQNSNKGFMCKFY